MSRSGLLLGRDDLGRIRSGAVADMLVLDGDPNVPASLAGGSGFTPGSDERAAVARHREGMTTATKIPAAWAAAHWGEVFPRWVPGLRGRRVPALGAVVPAALGAAVLTLLWTWMAVSMSLGLRLDGRPQAATAPVSFGDWKGLVAVAAYAPLLLWGPLLGAVTISYWRRRRRS